MNKKSQKEPMSKRQALRLERARKQRTTRILTVGGILLVTVVFIGLLVYSSQQVSAGMIKVTPVDYPQMDGSRVGDPNAKVKIEIFEDFHCSACQAYTQSIEPTVIKELVITGKAYYEFHNYPFEDDQSTIKDSDNAAMAVLCAGEQNRFWDLKNLLYANVQFVWGEFSDERLESFAEMINLDMKQFKSCYSEKRYQADIDASIALGQQYQVQGTPSVFVNGEYLTPGYVPTFEQIREAVEKALAQ
ncbi:MAG: thioredoxin domain-containing protein [Anaerolineales bacterium]|nr:thioredoxin domain-containing protein [Anaerolineales bacterium]